MMKSTLIKDLYGEIDRLKAGKWKTLCFFVVRLFPKCFLAFMKARLSFLTSAEVHAAREKNGVYIPKERYYQEESERKVLYWVYL